jgi:hypothetical protein
MSFPKENKCTSVSTSLWVLLNQEEIMYLIAIPAGVKANAVRTQSIP